MLKRVAVVFFAVFLSVMPALAMTADEFLSHKDENREAAMRVLGAAEEGGVPKLLLQAKMLPSLAKSLPDKSKLAGANRAAFLHCAFAAHLIKGLPKGEQEQYGNDLINTLNQLAASLNMSEDEMFKTLQGASGIFDGILSGDEGGAQEQVPVAKNTPAKTNTRGGMLEQLKCSYLPGFPANEGYQTVGDSFEAFFEDPKWELQENASSGYGYVWHAVHFKGVGYVGQRRAIFQAILSWAVNEKDKRLEFSKCQFMLNGTRVNPVEEGDILATVMLDSKR